MKTKILSFILLICLLTACTQNQRVRRYGGQSTIQLDKERKLVNVTWKEGSLWILTTQMDSGYIPKSYLFSEHSNLGIVQGETLIIEWR